jgi:hypothetical protein
LQTDEEYGTGFFPHKNFSPLYRRQQPEKGTGIKTSGLNGENTRHEEAGDRQSNNF